jgi:hypothetical protein
LRRLRLKRRAESPCRKSPRKKQTPQTARRRLCYYCHILKKFSFKKNVNTSRFYLGFSFHFLVRRYARFAVLALMLLAARATPTSSRDDCATAAGGETCFNEVARESHPIHVSLTTIDFNPQERSLEITCKIFADDLEDAIKKTSGAQLYLGSQKENPAFATAKIEEYLRRHFRVEFVGAPALAEWTFVGRELEGDAMWCYLEYASVALPSPRPRVKVAQTVLLDLYDDQTNVVNLSIGGERRSALIRKAKHSEILDF